LGNRARARGSSARVGRRVRLAGSTAAADAQGGDGAPLGERAREARPRRRVRRPLRAHARLGGAPIRARSHRLGAASVLRVDLTSWYAPAMSNVTHVTWSFPTTIVFGIGSLSTLGDHVRRAGGKRALVVCDPGVVKAEIADRVRKVLEAAGIATAAYD